jgi:hypothetical protein
MKCDGTGGWGRLSGDYLFPDMSAEELAVTLYEVVIGSHRANPKFL